MTNVQIIVLDEADVLSPASIMVVELAKRRRWPWKFLLTTATLSPDTLQWFECSKSCVLQPRVQRPFPTSVIPAAHLQHLFLALLLNLGYVLDGKYLLQCSAKNEVLKLGERLASATFTPQLVWAGIQLDPEAEGYVSTER